MRRYRVSVCKGPDCKGNGSDAVFRHATEALPRLGLAPRCELYRGGCYGLCHLGPNVVVREKNDRPADPFSTEDFQLQGTADEAYYWQMTPEKMERMLLEHVAHDRPVRDLLGDPDTPEDFRAPQR